MSANPRKGITTSSTAEYFSKNLQQVGFSSQTKAVLTTLKEAVDNSLDACEDHGILPELRVLVEKSGAGTLKNSDRIRVRVEDNGPGIPPEDIPKVFGEYLASSKFGRGRCSRGQQGIGISAATTWAQLTTATGARVISKTAGQRKALSCLVEVDIKNNKGTLKEKDTIDWDRPHGTSVEFELDGRIQLNGEAGLTNYLLGNVLVNPHMTLHYKLQDADWVTVERVTNEIPKIPDSVEPHPHTMKLGEFIAHSHLFGRVKVEAWLRKGFSRVTPSVIEAMKKTQGIKKALLEKNVDQAGDADFKELYAALQNVELMAPSTQSVLSIGEHALEKSIQRLGDVDFFSVVTRRPAICDFKPVQVEVAIARQKNRAAGTDADEPAQVLRFANRVPLQFDKAACAIVGALTTVNWRTYGLAQPKASLPIGPYVMAVSVVSPFIKFKNASKETIDSSDELVEEIRRALMMAGQRLSRHIKSEARAADLERRIQHIEQFGPILVEGLVRITGASASRKAKAEEGLRKILGRDAKEAQAAVTEANEKLEEHLKASRARRGEADDDEGGGEAPEEIVEAPPEKAKVLKKSGGKKAPPPAKGKAKAKGRERALRADGVEIFGSESPAMEEPGEGSPGMEG
ncbi:MAG: DNA topoisomerase VI subunit B [Bdellovibrionales bacterium]|nr:DNA topoisomerase VI subunit B [Bdellovibrionales bacterium]